MNNLSKSSTCFSSAAIRAQGHTFVFSRILHILLSETRGRPEVSSQTEVLKKMHEASWSQTRCPTSPDDSFHSGVLLWAPSWWSSRVLQICVKKMIQMEVCRWEAINGIFFSLSIRENNTCRLSVLQGDKQQRPKHEQKTRWHKEYGRDPSRSTW